MERITVQVLAPTLERQALELLISTLPGFRAASEPGQVGVLAGMGWHQRFENLPLDRPPRTNGALVLVTGPAAGELLQATRLDINAFFDPEEDADALRDCLLRAADGGSYCSPSLVPALLTAARTLARADGSSGMANSGRIPLSRREEEIVTLVRRGLRSEEIEALLGISSHTVKSHLANIYRKLGVSGQAALRQSIPWSRVDGRELRA